MTLLYGDRSQTAYRYVAHYIYYVFLLFFFQKDLLTYKNLQKYATKYIHMYSMKYNKFCILFNIPNHM